MEDKDLTGKFCYEIVHKGSQVFENCPGERVMETLQRESMELELGDKWLEVIVDPILDDYGRYKGSVHVISDITERKHLALELQLHRDNLEKLVKERTKELESNNEELEKLNQLFVGREFRIKELKEENDRLKEELNKLRS